MPQLALFGVDAATLDEARLKVENVLGAKLTEREGLYLGGVHFTLNSPSKVLDLRNNVDLLDTENEFNGLAEPAFPGYRYLLYLSRVDEFPEISRKIEAAPGSFIKLKSE